MKYLQKSFYVRAAQLLSVASMCMGASTLCSDTPSQPRVVVDPAGNEVALWEVDGDTSSSIQSAFFPDPNNAGNWTTPVTISGSENAFEPTVMATDAGDIIAVWYSYDSVSGFYNLATSTFATSTIVTSGTWSSPFIVTPSNHDVSDFQVKIHNSTSEVVLFWTAFNSTTSADEAWTSTMSFGGSWSAPMQLF
jgi:hypothetical protein